jgi:hypothetical protein
VKILSVLTKWARAAGCSSTIQLVVSFPPLSLPQFLRPYFFPVKCFGTVAGRFCLHNYARSCSWVVCSGMSMICILGQCSSTGFAVSFSCFNISKSPSLRLILRQNHCFEGGRSPHRYFESSQDQLSSSHGMTPPFREQYRTTKRCSSRTRNHLTKDKSPHFYCGQFSFI